MSNLINPKPRFGYNPTNGLLYDYVAQKDIAPTDKPYEAPDGTWNLNTVKLAILAGQTIEEGHLSVKKASPPATGTPPNPKTTVSAATPKIAAKPAPTPPTTLAPTGVTTGLSAEQLQALKLSPLQMAALGITPTQLNVTGLTALQVANWALSEARADALKLTPAQREALLP